MENASGLFSQNVAFQLYRLGSYYHTVGKNAKRSSLKKCSFVNSALKIQCHVKKYSDFSHWVVMLFVKTFKI